MYKILKRAALLAMALLLAGNVSAVRKDPYSSSRIFWDRNSEKTLFSSGNYARIIQLQDGRIMAAAEAGGGISVCYSSNYGQTWTSPEVIIRSANKVPYAVPDLIQLTDGTIIVGFNPRPSEPYSEDRKFGIRAVRSTDNGRTWSNAIFIFDAQHTFNDGCWEPSFLELPSGELQCYFANENDFTSSNEQCISMCRSFDKGLTWGEPVRISFRPGTRDGMPVPILTADNEIVVIIEDNGWPGRSGFRATTVRCSLKDNWSSVVGADSPNRNMIFANEEDKQYASAAPYLRQLATGETIASWQGDYGDRAGVSSDAYGMFVAVGDADAKNFKGITAPFDLSMSEHSLWNSVTSVGDGSVIALGSIGGQNVGNAIHMVKGYPMNHFEANYGTPALDGTFVGDDWTYKNAQQVIMGQVTGNRTTADFLYDHDNLYFTARVIDRDIFTDKVDNDGVFLSLDMLNASDTYPQTGMFQFFFNVDGTMELKYGENNRWNDAASTDGVNYQVSLKSFYYDVEVAIPWEVLGLEAAPTPEDVMRVNIEVRNRIEGAIETEKITDTETRESWTWMEFRVNEAPEGAGIGSPDDEGELDVYVYGQVLHVTSPDDMAECALYTYDGKLIGRMEQVGKSLQWYLPARQGGILSVTKADGQRVSRKF